ncbi:unnamed protein product [Ixodes hexagonus]
MNYNRQRERLRQAIGRQLEGEIERSIAESDCGEVDQIIAKICRSAIWRKFQKSYLLNLDQNGNQGPSPPFQDRGSDVDVGVRPRNGSTISFASLVTESSFNRDEINLTPERIHEVCNLIRSPTPSSKLHAIDILNSLSCFENVVTSDEWPVLEERIRSLFSHPSEVVKRETLRLFWAMLSSGGIVFEKSYTSLLLAARDQVCGKINRSSKSRAPNPTIDIVDILNTYHRNLPHHWLRFHRKALKHVIEETLAFMDDSIYENFSCVWKALAASDRHAVWLGNWTFGSESRAVVFESMANHTNILLHSVQLVTNFKRFPDLCKRHTDSHVYAACILLRTIRYEKGRALVTSLGSSATSDKAWFDVLMQVILFSKVLWASKYEQFMEFLPVLSEIVGVVCSAEENPMCPQRADSLISNFVETSRNLSDDCCPTHILSKCLKAICSSPVGLALIMKSSYKACRVCQIILSITKRAIEQTDDDKLCKMCVSSLLEVCAHIVGNPDYLLSEGCAATVKLLLSASRLAASQELSLEKSMTKFIASLFSTSLGTALVCVGTVPQSCERTLLKQADIYNKLKYFSMQVSPHYPREHIVLELCDYLWTSASEPDPKFELESMQEKLLCLMSSFRHCRALLAQKADSQDVVLWNEIVFLPRDHVPSEENLVLSLGVLKGLLCCLKTYTFLSARYSVDKRLQDLLVEFLNDDGKLMLSEISVAVTEMQKCIALYGQLLTQKGPPRQKSAVFAPSKSFTISLKHAHQKKKEFDAFLVTGTIHSAAFIDFIDFEDAQAHPTTLLLKPMTAEQDCGIRLTIACGLRLGLLSSEEPAHAQKLENLIRNSRNFYGASCSRDSYDFLLATIFLLLQGDERKSFQLHKFLCDRDCYFLYFPDMYGICDTLLCAALCQLFEVVLREHLPRLYHAFQMSRCAPSGIFRHWVGQFFWNYLDFDQISAVLLMVVVHGGEHLLYVCVCILRHVEDSLLRGFSEGCFVLMLREAQADGFRLSSCVDFIRTLSLQYRGLVQRTLSMYKH